MGHQTQILTFKPGTLKSRALFGPYREHGVQHMTNSNNHRASLSADNDQTFTQTRAHLRTINARRHPTQPLTGMLRGNLDATEQVLHE